MQEMADAKKNRFTKYFPLVLDALRSTDPNPMRPAEVLSWISKNGAPPGEDVSRRIQGGSQSIFENDVHWARFYLVKAGLVSNMKRGHWALTPAGRETQLTPTSTWDLYVRVRDANRPGASDEDSQPAPEPDSGTDAPAYWFAGAVWGSKGDQSDRFVKEGIWVNGYDNKFRDHVARMKPGDRIAIKAALVQKKKLPFDVGNRPVSCMRIKITGTVTGNKGDGKTVTVKWDAPSAPRDWYFYTYRKTLTEAVLDDEMAQKLIDFTFHGAKQDYDWWLKQPYWAKKYSQAPSVEPKAELVPEETEDEDSAATTEVAPTYTLESVVAEGCFLSISQLADMLKVWREKKNLILQGPPGTGKTFLAKRLGFALIGSNDRETARARLRVVQFHPSLAYEDFVRGYRPKGKEGLDLVDGILMQSIKDALSERDREFVLVIEEINRGNPAQIFGEFLTLLEAGKRRIDESIELAYRRSDGERVFVPENLHLIGTMNVADRSLALVDLALRRRFAFIDLEPNFGDAWANWCQRAGIRPDFIVLMRERLLALNGAIAGATSLGPQFRVGHSFVTPEKDERVADERAWFRSKVETEIGPLLDEYWYDAVETAKKARHDLLVGI